MEFERTIAAGEGTADGLAQTLAGAGEGDAPDPGESLTQGVSLGRYVIVGRLGEGGMGVVFAAYDPELDRRVALKLLSRASVGDEARLRMLREAQAMARLQHPNVVTVHDVGTTPEGRVWVAMEHVRGVTLRQWLARPRPWSQVLEVMRAVARGLIAAHEAGLVHRDVKPENVMIGDDGRVLVMDFGLARAGEAPPEPVTLEVSGSSLLGSALTGADALVGTPRYMAPEQLARGAVDARADQFAWCVVCWEALYGERPFAGETLEALRRDIMLGRRRTPARRGVPGGVHRALERGLAGAPERRYPSMAALLKALDAALRRRRWRFVAYGALALSVGAGCALGLRHAQAVALAETCAAAGAEIGAVWGEAPARRVAEAFAATGRAGAADQFARVRPWLDGYAAAWTKARAEQCVAAGGPEPEAGGVALECLEERRASLEALVSAVLEQADENTPTRAVSVAARLPQISLCRDAGWLARAPRLPQDPEVRARVVALHTQLERSITFQRAGRLPAAEAKATAVMQEAEALGWSPLIAEARLQFASVKVERAEFPAAVELLERVAIQAEADGHDRVVAVAAERLAYVLGDGLGRPDDGVRWGRFALAVLRRLGEDKTLRAGDALAALAIVEEARGNHEEGRRLKERVLEVRERHLGPEHPSVGTAYNLLGVNRFNAGDIAGAQRAHERGLAIRLAALGPDHLEVGSSYLNLGNVFAQRGNYATAIDYYSRARRTFEAVLGMDHPMTAAAIDNTALCQRVLGELDAALANHRRVLEIRQRVHGPQHPMVASVLYEISDVLYERGELAGAEAGYREALAMMESTLGSEHQYVAYVLQRLGMVLRVRGDLEAAVATLERAAAIGRARETSPEIRAGLDFSLGQALWDSGRERERARELILRALPHLFIDGLQEVEVDTAEARAWLAKHDGELRTVALQPSG